MFSIPPDLPVYQVWGRKQNRHFKYFNVLFLALKQVQGKLQKRTKRNMHFKKKF
jgi:hypothetical protein